MIEDEHMVRKRICYLLRQLNFGVNTDVEMYEAEDAFEAEELLITHSFDIVLSDINMPDRDGLSLLSKWYEVYPHTQWVIISGYDSFQYAQRAMVYGVKDYLLKPISKDKLSETVDRLVENIKKKNNDFIKISEIENILIKLEEVIWFMNEELVQKTVNEWENEVEKKDFGTHYYRNLMNHLINTLSNRINQKGSIQLDCSYILTGNNIESITREFVQSCHKIIDEIRIQRKGKLIDPIEAAKQYMEKNVCARVNLDDVAQRLGLNSSYFSQLFKKETGQTFVEYRTQLRMETAKRLLESSDLRIIDISNEIGYDDATHFTKMFKKHTGYSPKEYRNLLGIKQ